MFAGCPVFNVGSGDYAKCMHGRMKYERWNKKMDMHEMDNQEIRTYAHRNPGKPIIIKDSTYGTMSYFVPPKKEVDEATVRHNKSRKPKGKSYKTGDDSYVDTELSKILGTKKPKSGTKPNYPAGDHPGLDPDLKLDHLECPLDESLGGPGGPSREMSPNDMYTSGLRTKALLKKLQDKTTAAKYNKLADKLDKLKKEMTNENNNDISN